MEEADALCQRIGIMCKGELQCLGTPLHLKSKFGEGYTLSVSLQGFSADEEEFNRRELLELESQMAQAVLQAQAEAGGAYGGAAGAAGGVQNQAPPISAGGSGVIGAQTIGQQAGHGPATPQGGYPMGQPIPADTASTSTSRSQNQRSVNAQNNASASVVARFNKAIEQKHEQQMQRLTATFEKQEVEVIRYLHSLNVCQHIEVSRRMGASRAFLLKSDRINNNPNQNGGDAAVSSGANGGNGGQQVTIALSKIFAKLEDARSTQSIPIREWSIAKTTLDEVFLRIVTENNAIHERLLHEKQKGGKSRKD
jgi:ABC-type multidrug transport system ATPase subunit